MKNHVNKQKRYNKTTNVNSNLIASTLNCMGQITSIKQKQTNEVFSEWIPYISEKKLTSNIMITRLKVKEQEKTC